MVDIDFQKNLIYGFLACERLLPNYIFFHHKSGFGSPDILKDYLTKIRNLLLNPDQKIDFAGFERDIDKVTPAPHNYDTVLASSALDACAALMELIHYTEDRKIDRINTITTAALDSVDMFIQENELLDMSNPKFESIIQSHPLMIRERKRQKDIWEYLNKMSAIDENDVETLEKLQYNNGMGHLDLRN